jgi:hypothetical protein
MKNNKCHNNPNPQPDEFDTQIRPEGHVLPTLQIDLTPRLWSYFEVSVSPRDPKIESKASAANADPNTLSETFINSSASLIECIAIGLSTEVRIRLESPRVVVAIICFELRQLFRG